jgi:hypothetical protein
LDRAGDLVGVFRRGEAAGGVKMIKDEMKKMAVEPLLPIEKKLVAWSLGLGVGLLVVLVWVSRVVFG